MKYNIKMLQSCLRLLFMMLPAGAAAQNMSINNCRVILNGPVHLVLHNAGVQNNGVFATGEGIVSFTGDQPSGIAGFTPYTIRNMVIDKQGMQGLTLLQDVVVPGSIRMSNGKLLLNGRTLDLGNTGSIEGESDQAYITGTNGGRVLVSRNLSAAPNDFNPGNIGVELSAPAPLGTITIERRHQREALASGNFGMHRSFTIYGTLKAGADVNARLRFLYLENELAGIDESSLAMFTRSDVGNFWSQLGRDDNSTIRNWVMKENLQKLGSFTLGGGEGSPSSSSVQKELKPVFFSGIRVQPNPTQGVFSLVFYAYANKNIVLNLYDQRGHLLQQKQIACERGLNTVPWDIDHYPPGTYIIGDDSGSIYVKVIRL